MNRSESFSIAFDNVAHTSCVDLKPYEFYLGPNIDYGTIVHGWNNMLVGFNYYRAYCPIPFALMVGYYVVHGFLREGPKVLLCVRVAVWLLVGIPFLNRY